MNNSIIMLKRTSAALVLFFISVNFTYGQSRVKELDELIGKYHETHKFNGSVLVADQGKVIFKNGYGMANMEWDIPNAPDTKHRLGSITKQFTALLILQLAAEDQLDLNAPISNYLPDYPKDKADIITTHHLLTHTSGIPNYTSFPDFFEKKSQTYAAPNDFVKVFQDKDLDFKPGEKFSYSNSGYFLLGVIIETISGKTYEEMLEEKIFSPLNMNDTGYDNHSFILKNRATGYEKKGFSYENSRYLDMSIPYAAGSMYSTAEDLYKWDQALYTNSLLPQKYMDLYFKKHVDAFNNSGYSYGWIVGKQSIGNSQDSIFTIQHGGGINGFNTLIARYPEDKALIVLLNNTGGAPLNEMSKSIIGILKGASYEMPKNSIVMEMHKIISEEGLESGLQFYHTHKNSADYEVNEGEINRLGYLYMEEGKYSEAAKLFKINMERFPQSSNVYDSYAESMMELGNTEEAIVNYKKSVELDRANQNAIDKLKELGVDTSTYEEVITVPEALLESYVGVYELQPGFKIEITKEGQQMKAKATGQGVVDIFPKTDSRFYLKVVDAEIEFTTGEEGKVESLTLFQSGRKMLGKRVENKE